MKKILFACILSLTATMLTGCIEMKGIDVNNFTETTSTGDEFVDSNLGSYNMGIPSTLFDFSSLGEEYQEILDAQVDIDVLNLSDIVAFAQVNNMMMMADDYLGMTVKVHGNYYRHYIEEIDFSYHFLLLVDGTNCCTGILEFMMEDGVEYPNSGENLILMGEYSKYTDEYGTYPYIIVSDYMTY